MGENAGERRPSRSALGRGLSALISTPVPVSQSPADSNQTRVDSRVGERKLVPFPVELPRAGQSEEVGSRDGPQQALGLHYLPLGVVFPDPKQPRQQFDLTEIEELASSIRTLGILQPILARPSKGESTLYEIVAGERRWRAAQLAGLTVLPVVVRDIEDREALEIALVENVQRQALNPIDEARAYHRLVEEFHLSQDAIAERVGKDRASVANYLRLLKLPTAVQEELCRGTISIGHAKAILTVREPAAQQNLCRKVITEQLSVRALEAIVARAVVLDPARKRRSIKTSQNSGTLEPLIDRMREALGTKVSVLHHPSGRGKIVIEYFSEQELDRVADLLCRGR